MKSTDPSFVNPQYPQRLFRDFEKDIVLHMDAVIEDVSVSAFKYMERRYGRILRFWIFWYGVWFILCIALIVPFPLIAYEPRIVLFLIMLPAIVYAFFREKIITRTRNLFYEQFARTGEYTYERTGPPAEEFRGAIFTIGHDQAVADLVRGSFGPFPFSVFVYTYTVGHGRSSTKYARTILEIDFLTPVPSVLLLSGPTVFGDNLSDNTIRTASKVRLPEEVERRFDLFTERKFEIEALQIFTPDILTEISENYHKFSFDFVGTKLYIYAPEVCMKRSDLEKLVGCARFLIREIADDIRQMRGSMEALNERFVKNG